MNTDWVSCLSRISDPAIHRIPFALLSLYRVRTGRISDDGLTEVKNQSFTQVDGARAVLAFMPVRVFRASFVQGTTLMLAAVSSDQRPSSSGSLVLAHDRSYQEMLSAFVNASLNRAIAPAVAGSGSISRASSSCPAKAHYLEDARRHAVAV